MPAPDYKLPNPMLPTVRDNAHDAMVDAIYTGTGIWRSGIVKMRPADVDELMSLSVAQAQAEILGSDAEYLRLVGAR